MFGYLDREIAAHAIDRGLFARDHREAAALRFVVEILHQFLELTGRQAIDGLEGNSGAARLCGRHLSTERPPSGRRT